MEGVPVISLIGLGLALFFGWLDRRSRKILLQHVAARLGGEQDSSVSAWGGALGPYATVSFVNRRGGRAAPAWTEIDVELPRRYPLTLHVRRHESGDRAAIARGAMVDVEVGDAAFDDAFLVEAAPADVVRHLLTPAVRRYLTGSRRVELLTPPDREGILQLALKGWDVQLFEVDEALDLAIEIAASVRDAFAEVEAETPAVPAGAGSPFRQELDDRPAREAQARREDEVARVADLRPAREARSGIYPAIAVAIVGTIVVAVLSRL